MSASRKHRLGRGLAALLGESMTEPAEAEEGIREVATDRIVPNPFQPRRDFSENELQELSESIRENGLLQPLVVRPSGGADRPRYQLVAGERRLRAVRLLDWESVPAVVREVDDETLLVLALVENLQRESLNPLEEAEGYQVLSEEFGLTQQEIAESVGKNRSTVANMLRLLRLPPSVRKLLEQGGLTMGHARAILGLDDSVKAGELARKAASRGWSVREVEERVRKAGEGEGRGTKEKAGRGSSSSEGGRNPAVHALEEELRKVLGTRTQIRRKPAGDGEIRIPFHDDQDLERVFTLISGREATDVLS